MNGQILIKFLIFIAAYLFVGISLAILYYIRKRNNMEDEAAMICFTWPALLFICFLYIIFKLISTIIRRIGTFIIERK